jgi:hypothetical protein
MHLEWTLSNYPSKYFREKKKKNAKEEESVVEPFLELLGLDVDRTQIKLAPIM